MTSEPKITTAQVRRTFAYIRMANAWFGILALTIIASGCLLQFYLKTAGVPTTPEILSCKDLLEREVGSNPHVSQKDYSARRDLGRYGKQNSCIPLVVEIDDSPQICVMAVMDGPEENRLLRDLEGRVTGMLASKQRPENYAEYYPYPDDGTKIGDYWILSVGQHPSDGTYYGILAIVISMVGSGFMVACLCFFTPMFHLSLNWNMVLGAFSLALGSSGITGFLLMLKYLPQHLPTSLDGSSYLCAGIVTSEILVLIGIVYLLSAFTSDVDAQAAEAEFAQESD